MHFTVSYKKEREREREYYKNNSAKIQNPVRPSKELFTPRLQQVASDYRIHRGNDIATNEESTQR